MSGPGRAGHRFANDTERWRWAYVLVMEGSDSAGVLPSGAA